MKLTLKDGSVRDFADGITALEAAASISGGWQSRRRRKG